MKTAKTADRRPYIMPVSRTRATLFKRRLDRFTRMLRGLEKGDARSLHRARVESRRLRELLPTLQLKNTATTRKLTRRLRKITARLGAVRELDVLLLQIDKLRVSHGRRSGAVGRVGVAVARERDEARKRLLERLPLDALRRLTRKLETVAEELTASEQSRSTSAERSWRWVVDARVARRASRLAAALENAGAVYVPERLHAARIAVKKLRYGAELATDITGDSVAALRVLKRGQDVLGRMHDIQVLIERVRQVQASLTPPSLAVWRDLDALVLSLENDCRRLHGHYMRARPALEAVAAKLTGGRVSGQGGRVSGQDKETRPLSTRPLDSPPGSRARRAG